MSARGMALDDGRPMLQELALRSQQLDAVLDEFAELQRQLEQGEQKRMRRSQSLGAIGNTPSDRPCQYAGATMLKGKIKSLRPCKLPALNTKPKYTQSEYQFGTLLNESRVVTLKFAPMLGGIRVNGAQVVQSSGQAWMMGVRPGWSITSISGVTITNENEDEVEELLEKADQGRARYELVFQKGRAKFGTGVAKMSNLELEKEANYGRLRKAFKFQGHIERPEYRAITYAQLERVLGYAAEYCHAWKDQAPQDVSQYSGKTLNLDILNFAHANAWIMLPTTEKRKTSFVEHLSATRQIPKWCVIHWWGLTLVDFMKCMKMHLTTRGLTVDTPYWISIFALRQHGDQEEIFLDKRSTSFFKALNTSTGQALMVLDTHNKAFTRTWCIYELTMCCGHGNTPFDMAVCHHSKAHLLTHGLSMAEEGMENKAPGSGIAAKLAREEDFPLLVAAHGMEIEVEKSECLQATDRAKILNFIAGQRLDAEPLAAHDSYNEVNKRLHGYFGAHLMLRATTKPDADSEAGQALWKQINTAILSDVWRKNVDWKLDGISEHGMQLLLQSIPLGTEDMMLRLRAAAVMDDDLVYLAEVLSKHPRMNEKSVKRSVSLDLRNCEEVGDGIGDDVWKAAFEMVRELGVDLNLDYTDMEAKEGEDPTSKAIGIAMQVNMVREGVPLKLYRRKVVPAVPELAKILAQDENVRARRAAAKALGNLGQAAMDAVPALQAAERDDPEDSVKALAATALQKVTGVVIE